MNTYEPILLVIIGVVIWDIILKPLIRGMWKIFLAKKQKQREIDAEKPREKARIVESARRAVWVAKAERKIKAVDQIWEAQKRLEQMQHIVVKGMMMLKDSPDVRKTIMEKMQCGSIISPLNVEYINKMAIVAETPDEARTYVGEEFWNAWENYKGFIIASHTGPVLEKEGLLRAGRRAVWYEDTQIMEQLRNSLPEEWLTRIWKESGFASDLVAQGLKEVMLHAAKKELDEKEQGLSSGRLFDRTWNLSAEDKVKN